MGGGGDERDTGWSQSGSRMGPKLAPTLVRARWHARWLARPRLPTLAPTDAEEVFGGVREAFPDRSCHRQGRHGDERKKREGEVEGWLAATVVTGRSLPGDTPSRSRQPGKGREGLPSWTVGAISTPAWFGPSGVPADSLSPARRPQVLPVPGRRPVESERPSPAGRATAREGIVTKNREERRKKRRGRRRKEERKERKRVGAAGSKGQH